VTIASKSVTLRGGQRRKVKVSLNGTGKSLLARHKRFSALLKIVSGHAVIRTTRVALRHR
jgi:hypothetical protein